MIPNKIYRFYNSSDERNLLEHILHALCKARLICEDNAAIPFL